MDRIKNTFISTILLTSIAANAGTMGAEFDARPLIAPFASLEGSYTWNGIKSSTINGTKSTLTTDGWGGRAAVGLKHNYTHQLSLSGEIGWGYYGSTKQNLASLGSNAKFTITGIDFLFGPLYHYRKVDIFAKAGVMLESVRNNALLNLGTIHQGGLVSGLDRRVETYSGALPELKAGGIYNVNDNLGISLAYMFVSGYNPKLNKTFSSSGGRIIDSGVVSTGATTLSTIMLGLTYNFV